jgi:hypothetical protein
MRAGTLIAAAAICAGLGVPASACTLTVSNGGTLALSGDGRRFGSGESGGTAATFTIIDVGGPTLTISAPQIVNSPSGFNTGTAQVQAAYTATGLLYSVTQNYTPNQTQFNVGIITLVTVTLNNRIVSNAFVSGNYQTRTTVTCS